MRFLPGRKGKTSCYKYEISSCRQKQVLDPQFVSACSTFSQTLDDFEQFHKTTTVLLQLHLSDVFILWPVTQSHSSRGDNK